MCWCKVSLQLFCLRVYLLVLPGKAGVCACVEGHVQYLNAGEGLNVRTGEWGVTAHGTCWYM